MREHSPIAALLAELYLSGAWQIFASTERNKALRGRRGVELCEHAKELQHFCLLILTGVERNYAPVDDDH